MENCIFCKIIEGKINLKKIIFCLVVFSLILLPVAIFAKVDSSDKNIKIINAYYQHIGQGELKDAYNLRYDKKVSYKTFENWYKNVGSIEIYDVKKDKKNNYHFLVQMTDGLDMIEKYSVVMKVISGKLHTISSKRDYAINYCTDKPVTAAIGSNIYPREMKYKNISKLGVFFTAYKCGTKRLKQVYGTTSYDLGSNINLKKKYRVNTVEALKKIGYKCNDKNVKESQCRQWILSSTIDFKKLFSLEKFYQDFQSDDCVNCG